MYRAKYSRTKSGDGVLVGERGGGGKVAQKARLEIEENLSFSLFLFHPTIYHLIIPKFKNPHIITLPLECQGL